MRFMIRCTLTLLALLLLTVTPVYAQSTDSTVAVRVDNQSNCPIAVEVFQRQMSVKVIRLDQQTERTTNLTLTHSQPVTVKITQRVCGHESYTLSDVIPSQRVLRVAVMENANMSTVTPTP